MKMYQKIILLKKSSFLPCPLSINFLCVTCMIWSIIFFIYFSRDCNTIAAKYEHRFLPPPVLMPVVATYISLFLYFGSFSTELSIFQLLRKLTLFKGFRIPTSVNENRFSCDKTFTLIPMVCFSEQCLTLHVDIYLLDKTHRSVIAGSKAACICNLINMPSLGIVNHSFSPVK